MKRFLSVVLALVIMAGVCYAAMEMQPALADRCDAPFVGQNEDDIWWTSLGEPVWSVFQRAIWEGNKDATIYYWAKNGSLIFIARVEDGVVAAVRDNRKCVTDTVKPRQTSRLVIYDDKPEKEEDPYEASGYANAEDFYDDYYDDFFDYEEAEEYWEEHQEEEDW